MKNADKKSRPLWFDLMAGAVLSAIIGFGIYSLDKRAGYYRFEQYMAKYNISLEEIADMEMKPLYYHSPWMFYIVYKDEPEYTYIYDYYMAGGAQGLFNTDKIMPGEVIVSKNGEKGIIWGEEYENLKHPTYSLDNPPPDRQN